jgi:hypothetical protein
MASSSARFAEDSGGVERRADGVFHEHIPANCTPRLPRWSRRRRAFREPGTSVSGEERPPSIARSPNPSPRDPDSAFATQSRRRRSAEERGHGTGTSVSGDKMQHLIAPKAKKKRAAQQQSVRRTIGRQAIKTGNSLPGPKRGAQRDNAKSPCPGTGS